MDELRLSLLILGTCFIIGVLAHGIWKIRKNNNATKKERIEPGQWQDDNSEEQDDWSAEQGDDHKGYDDLGLGAVRVVSSAKPVADTGDDAESEPSISRPVNEDTDEKTVSKPEPQMQATKLYGSVVTNPKPHMQGSRHVAPEQADDDPIPDPPEFLIRKEQKAVADEPQADDFTLDAQQAEPAVKDNASDEQSSDHDIDTDSKKVAKKRGLLRRRQEPNFGDDQMRIDFDDSQSQPAAESGAAPSEDVEQEVLVVNVRAQDDTPISGAALLPLLLTLGFKFGDQDIFHRHVNSNGKGPVLFSLANMFKPGVFDIDNLENFTTQGVSLFMILPIDGVDAHQVFNMMHNAARKIADEFNAQILDGRRSVLTKQGLQQYMEKIREFERKRMITRH
ncbi:cell division protein ZipA [Alteromonas sp. RKMC-009]|uniref:cell division protein ZipA n=1 Tax=Alteromonas sp. RKMC-009 TaxID=2267264 RepID=UPI000E6A6B40|nr:cell division protein ZipA [Alteromonas sp. RKMC-009]AYA64363.1 cell division protein ZipA [Alteromonas sp. RKMC-009]